MRFAGVETAAVSVSETQSIGAATVIARATDESGMSTDE